MASARQTIPVEYIKECFTLEAGGVVRWKARPAHHFVSEYAARAFSVRVGKVAGRLTSRGYYHTALRYGGRAFQVKNHHIVWVLTHGHWPVQFIDHINRTKTDNRPENLRDVSISENTRNTSHQRGLPVGVYAKSGRFRTQVYSSGKVRHLGTFDTPEEASAVFNAAFAASNYSADETFTRQP